MAKSYRLRTSVNSQPGADQTIRVNIDQDFDFLEILSLKLTQSDVYKRFCSDYGVIVGRVVANGGFGVPNARVSVFVPVEDIDAINPVISTLYPYTSPSDINEDGYRYNLLPYEPSYEGHVATGTFPTKEDILGRTEVLEIYEKYYKYTVKTNESGDYMIVGVPTGDQKIVVDVDLSDMGCFSLRPTDLIKMGRGTREQFDGNNFRSSSDLKTLPQLVNIVKEINIGSFWGENDFCNVGITRVDFDLRDQNVDIKPTALFMGSIFSSPDEDYLKTNCKPKSEQGDLCGLVTGPGTILAIRQTIDLDQFGRPILEQFALESGGKVIDENGAFLVDVPMNLDYLITDEYGNLVVSQDPKVGIPSKGKYRFKIKYNSAERDIASIPNPTQFINANILNLQAFAPKGTVLRGNYLVPNVKEYGWLNDANGDFDPSDKESETKTKVLDFTANVIEESKTITIPAGKSVRFEKVSELNSIQVQINGVVDNSKWIDVPGSSQPVKITVIKKTDTINVNGVDTEVAKPVQIIYKEFDYRYSLFQRSYSFSLDWDDYPNYQDAIDCEDTFYEFVYNKVYTTSQLIDEYRRGTNRGRFLAIKEVLERSCLSEVNRFPINDGVRNFDLLYFIISVFFFLFTIILPVLVFAYDLIQILWEYVIKYILYFIVQIFVVLLEIVRAIVKFFSKKLADKLGSFIDGLQRFANGILNFTFPPIRLPLITYPDCSACDCNPEGDNDSIQEGGKYSETNLSILADVNLPTTYDRNPDISPTLSEYDQYQEEVYNEVYGQLASGRDDSDGKEWGRTPKYANEDNNRIGWLDTQIPIPERINMFNGKGKYFTQTPGGGYNRIKIFPNYTANTISSGVYSFYEDQPYVFLADQGSNTTLVTGQMISFISTDTSKDINYKSTIKVTGTTPSTKSITTNIVYADPNNPSQNIETKTFNLVNNYTGKTEYIFPVDVEYSQVVTAVTIGDLEKIVGTNSISDYGFYRRILKGQINVKLRYVDLNGNSQYRELNDKVVPVETITDYKKLLVVILMKGVDPYSTRQKTKVDISLPIGLPEGSVIVEGNYKLNQPILKGLSLPNYNQISSNSLSNPYYQSKFFTPSTNIDRGFSAFTSNTITLYSSYGLSTDGGGVASEKIGVNFGGYYAASTLTPGRWGTNLLVGTSYTDGYYPYEYVEGVSLMSRLGQLGPADPNRYTGGYYKLESRVYDTGYTLNVNNNQNIVMRTDRLPRSDSFDDQYIFAQNKSFALYTINETGGATASQSISSSLDFSNSDSGDFEDSYGTGTTSLMGSFSCGGIVPLGAYKPQQDGEPLEISTPEEAPDVYYVQERKDYPKVKDGCYVVADRIPKTFAIISDVKQIVEWKSRFMLNLAICRNVFGMTFTNQWVNGALYLPSFQNDKIYEGGLNVNDPTYNYCKDKLVFRIENNSFFYRSSPYNNGFIGMKAQKIRSQKGNDYFLGNPVTIMDLGPKDNIIKNICPNPVFDGYYVNRLSPTSFNQPADLFQLLIISRMTNSSFWGQLLSSGNAGISQFFSRQDGQKIDGDFAQLVSINSELGVVPFTPEGYNSDNLFFGKTTNPVVGVFFSSDTTTRDFVSPGRNTYIDTAKKFAFNSFGHKSQTVPMYKWSRDTSYSIGGKGVLFGSEKNDWYTNPTVNVGGQNFFYSTDYQTIDRLNDSTYYPSAVKLPTTQRPGYIYSSKIAYDSNNNPTGYTYDGFISTSTFDNSVFLVGAPFHFYFGLKVGKTALDKFITNYAVEV